MRLLAAIFDVEGTLIDCVPGQLESWRITLGSGGYVYTHADLQPFSGMDGQWMLDRLLPAESQERKDKLLQAQNDLYQREFLPLAEPLPSIRQLFEVLKARSVAIGIATTCKEQELAHYDERLRILELTDAVSCGEMVKHGKPDPALFRTCLKSLKIQDAATAVAIGDTPYDARAAKALGMRSAGVLTGGFSHGTLRKAGCDEIFDQARDVGSLWQQTSVAVMVPERR
jgi:HAD superfamily hydrolase (TIGR01509 family)